MDRFLTRKGVSAAEPVPKLSCFKGCRLPSGWSVHDDSLLVRECSGFTSGSDCKFAVLDFDDTLCRRGSRDGSSALTLPKDLCFDTIGTALQRLHNSNFRLVVLTNESNIQRFKKQEAIDRALKNKVGRLNSLVEHFAHLPILVLVATGVDKYRKGEGIGAWAYLTNRDSSSPDLTGSFMCGDAAGRPGDFSDSDRTFALAIGIQFLTPEELFGPDAAKRLDLVCGLVSGPEVDAVVTTPMTSPVKKRAHCEVAE